MDVDFVEPGWQKLEYTHAVFFGVFKDDEKLAPVIQFLKHQKLVE